MPASLVAERLSQRIATRDVPPPPPPVSHEPAAVAARVHAWLRATYGLRNTRTQRALAAMLLLLADLPEADTAALGRAAGLGPRVAARHANHLAALALTEQYYQGRTRYHRLLRPTEDALLPVVAGTASATP